MRNLFLSAVLLTYISCDIKTAHEEYKTFPKTEWHTDSVVKFNYFIQDTISRYDVILQIRHSVNYEYQNLFLFLDNGSSKDTIELLLADKNGDWFGRGIGDVREIEINYQTDKKYNKKGKYNFTLEQAMRYGDEEKSIILKNIYSIGVCVIKKENEI